MRAEAIDPAFAIRTTRRISGALREPERWRSLARVGLEEVEELAATFAPIDAPDGPSIQPSDKPVI
ncbi:MAG TPA: hypothetical protein VFZ11_06690 [Gemmatimonadaceae bacterium]